MNYRMLILPPLAIVCLIASDKARTNHTDETTSNTIPTFSSTTASIEPWFSRFAWVDHFAKLVESDPIAAMESGLNRYRKEVHGYKCTFIKQERIGGKLHPPEEIECTFREEPFAVKLMWKKGSRSLAEGVIYVQGENNGKMLAWVLRLSAKQQPTRDSIARSSSRVGIEDFGLALGSLRTHNAWLAVRELGELDTKYLGIKSLPELGNRPCYAIERTCKHDELDPFTMNEPRPVVTPKNQADSHRKVTIYIDVETWLQTGSEVHRSDGELIATYYFRDIELNPKLSREDFTGFKK